MPRVDGFDAEIPVIDAVRRKDPYAFEELVRRHNRFVRGVLFGVLGKQDRIDDLTQQVWTAVWERISELRDSRNWRSWLYRLVRNTAIDAGREITRRRRHEAALKVVAADSGAKSRPADAPVIEQERQGAVFAGIAQLPAIYREPFVLRHMNGWSYQQIAEVLGMPVESVETRLVRARRMLRDSLKDRI